MSDEVIRVRSAYAMSPRWWLVAAALAVVFWAGFGWSLVEERASVTMLCQAGVWTCWALTARGRDIVVDRSGIRLSPLGRVTWAQVRCVLPDSRWRESVTVRMRSGNERPTGIPKHLAPEVARIGGVPYGDSAAPPPAPGAAAS